jgi:RNA polymerase sigma factor (sigma-70 family)
MPARLQQAVRRLAAAADGTRTDAGLVADFLRAADQDAFAELVRRHGPMVLGVCRRFLGPTPDAEDAFQATFLVLVRRAPRADWHEALGPWLYGVALRVARRARASRSRRLATERQVSPMTPKPATAPRDPDDLAAVLDEELAALPEDFRRPLVLCELQGASRADAARELGLPEGTLSSRLARGRRMLRDRLARRGVAPTAAGLAVAVPADLAAATARNAAAVLSRATGTVPAAILSLTEGVVKAMIVNWKLTAVLVTACVTLTGLGAWQGAPGPAATAADPLRPVPPAVAPQPAETPPAETHPLPTPKASGRTPDVVATIFGDEAITRDEFAEHLIRRYGKKELELFVSKQVIRRAFGKEGRTMSAGEVQAALDADCQALGVTREQFVRDVLPRYGKTAEEWTEDVILPRLMLSQLCKAKVPSPTEEELRRAFDAKYGEKVECRMIVWTKDQGEEARKVYEKVRGDEQAFDLYARRQSDPNLAASGGLVSPTPRTPPPGGGGEGHEAVAKLKVGEVTPLVATRDGYFAARCLSVVPADKTKEFALEKPVLLREALEAKIKRAVPKLFDELKREADPKYHLTFPNPVIRPNPAPSGPPK